MILSWLFFGGVHSFTAANGVKQRLQVFSSLVQRYYRLLYNGLALLTFLPVLLALHAAPVAFISDWQGSVWAGWLVMGGGTLLGLVALKSYDLAEFVGWPVRPVTDGGSLRQQGLLRYVLHPLYLAILLVLGGMVVQQPDWKTSLFGFLAFLYIRIGIYFEEKKLIKTFGDVYIRYRQRTPMLIPTV